MEVVSKVGGFEMPTVGQGRLIPRQKVDPKCFAKLWATGMTFIHQFQFLYNWSIQLREIGSPHLCSYRRLIL